MLKGLHLFCYSMTRVVIAYLVLIVSGGASLPTATD